MPPAVDAGAGASADAELLSEARAAALAAEAARLKAVAEATTQAAFCAQDLATRFPGDGADEEGGAGEVRGGRPARRATALAKPSCFSCAAATPR